MKMVLLLLLIMFSHTSIGQSTIYKAEGGRGIDDDFTSTWHLVLRNVKDTIQGDIYGAFIGQYDGITYNFKASIVNPEIDTEMGGTKFCISGYVVSRDEIFKPTGPINLAPGKSIDRCGFSGVLAG